MFDFIQRDAEARARREEENARMSVVPDPRDFKPGIYEHYKGRLVRAICVAQECDTGKLFVIGRTCAGQAPLPGSADFTEMRVREYENFMEYLPEAGRRRFELLEEIK